MVKVQKHLPQGKIENPSQEVQQFHFPKRLQSILEEVVHLLQWRGLENTLPYTHAKEFLETYFQKR